MSAGLACGYKQGSPRLQLVKGAALYGVSPKSLQFGRAFKDTVLVRKKKSHLTINLSENINAVTFNLWKEIHEKDCV